MIRSKTFFSFKLDFEERGMYVTTTLLRLQECHPSQILSRCMHNNECVHK